MKEFFINAIGYITIAAMIFSIAYTWAKLNYEIRKADSES